MESFKTIANSQSEIKNLSTIDYRTIGNSKHLKADDRISEVYKMGLISDIKFKPYFYKKYYHLGDSTFMDMAHRAMQGKQPAKLFCSLLGRGK